MQNDMYSIKCTQLIQHHVQKRLPLRCILCRAKVSRMLLFLNFVNVSVKRWSVQVFRRFFFPQTGSSDQARPTRGTKWCQRGATVAQVFLSFSSARSFFWQLTKQTWSALTETLLIKTVLVLRMVVVLVFSSCDRDPPGQCPGTTWEAATYPPLGRAIRSPQVFNHVEVVIWISREDAASKHLKLNLTYLD